MTGLADAAGGSSYVYDSFGELTSEENGAGQTVGYAYNADGRVTGITYPLPSTATWAATDGVTYGYDNADLLTSVTDFNGHQSTIGNTADGLPDSASLGSSGDTITTTYDSTDKPSAIALKNSSSTLQSFTYSDSPAGTIMSETDTPSSSNSPANYSYDAEGRITSDTPGTGTAKDYGFDASSNLTALPTGATGSYNDAGELTSSALSGTTTNYTYNADGEQLTSTQGSATKSSATWNGATELASYDNSAADMTTATYDGNGLRASTTTTPAGGSAITQGYVWSTVASVPQLLMDGTSAYIYGTGQAPTEQVNLSTGTITYLVTDVLGSVRGTVTSVGTLTGATSYDAWGNPLTAGGLTSVTPFGFAGGYTDPDGLVYLINRYYNPQAGQFISVDPDLSQTYEPYEYANGNPVSELDATGDYGYFFTYWLGYSSVGPVRLMTWINHHFSAVFPFWNVPNHLVDGQTIWLDRFAPVYVLDVWDTGFQLYSLPGHPEGADKTITFDFWPGGGRTMYMSVEASGPNDTWCNRNSVCAAFNNHFLAYPIWGAFAWNIWWETPWGWLWY